MNPIDLNHLTVFAKIVESGSLTKASLALHQPKSRVSRVLSALERDLGLQLVHRTTRHLQLTDIGRRFYEHCKGPLAGLEEATRDLADCAEDVQGVIRLTAPQDMGTSVLPTMIDEFSKMYPKIHFEVVLAQESLNLVSESIDVAIRFGPLKDSSMKAQKVAEISLILVASPNFIETQPPLNQLSDIMNLPCLSFEATKGKAWSFNNGREKRTLKVKHTMIANNPEFLLKMALKHRGVALLPDFLCRDHLQTGALVQLFRTWKSDVVPLSLVFPYQKQLPYHIRRFADFLKIRLQATMGKAE
jgi:DNA-binding transcriptional LysR family regulator